MNQQQATAKKITPVNVNPAEYPTVNEACKNFRDFMEGLDGEVTAESNELHWRRIFSAAQTDGLVSPAASYEDYGLHLSRDLSDLVIQAKEDEASQSIDRMITEMLGGLKALQ